MAHRYLLITGFLFSTLQCGCQVLRTTQHPDRFQYQLVRDQLVLHSDFSLPEEHRLIDELTAQRSLISEKLQLEPKDEPIHVFLFAEETDYYEFLNLRYPGFPERRAIFVKTDVQLSVYAHWGDQVAVDLRHEVCHGYLHASVPHLPLWLDEGLAEFFEVGRVQQGLNRPHVELLYAQHTAGLWEPNLSRLEALTSAVDMTQEDYAEAWAWVHFLLQSSDMAPLLTDYLNTLRQDTTTATFGTLLHQRLAHPELALLEHLKEEVEKSN